jgi:hypothetical protein
LLEFVGLRRLDCKIAIGPTIGRIERRFEDLPRSQEEARILPRLAGDLESVARIKDKGRFNGQAKAAVAPVFETEGAAFERMQAFAAAVRYVR